MQLLTNKVTAIILRERIPNERGEATGWLILLARKTKIREILAVLSSEVELKYAQHIARMMAAKYSVNIIEELATPELAASLEAGAAQVANSSLA
jgi:hypothetical protein